MGGRTGAAPGLKHQLVVADRLRAAVECGTGGDRVVMGVDVDDLGVDPDIESEPVEEALGRLEQQVVLVLDHAADEIGQSAVGVGDVARPLDHCDRGPLVEASEPCGRRHAPGHATDDHHTCAASSSVLRLLSSVPFHRGLHPIFMKRRSTSSTA